MRISGGSRELEALEGELGGVEVGDDMMHSWNQVEFCEDG